MRNKTLNEFYAETIFKHKQGLLIKDTALLLFIVEAMLQREDTWNFVTRFAEEILRAKKIDLDNTISKDTKSDVSPRPEEQQA